MFRLFLAAAFVLAIHATCPAQSAPSDAKEAPKTAFVKLINASEVNLPQPWKAGLDLTFKDVPLASDIRSGEKCSYRKIRFTGDDHVVVKLTGSKTEAARIPADFEAGCFYTLLIHGSISSNGENLQIKIRKDYPEDSALERKGQARVNVINAVSSFPLAVRISGSTRKVGPGESFDSFFPGGEQSLDLVFTGTNGVEKVRHNAISVQPDNSYSAVIANSPEGGYRPLLIKACETLEVREALKQEKDASDERKGASGAPE